MQIFNISSNKENSVDVAKYLQNNGYNIADNTFFKIKSSPYEPEKTYCIVLMTQINIFA